MSDEEEHVPMVEGGGGGGVLGADEPVPTPSKSEASKRAAASSAAARRGGARSGASSSTSSSGPSTLTIVAAALLALNLVAFVFYNQSAPRGGGVAAHASGLHANASSLAAAAAALAAAADQLAVAAVSADGAVAPGGARTGGAPGSVLAPGELSLLPALTAALPLKPEMTPAEVSLLARSLLASSHVWEWGCGGSTALAGLLGNIRSIRSVDSLALWRDRVLNATARYGKRVHIVLVNLGRTKAWGWPADESSRPLWPAYPQAFRDRAAVGTGGDDDGAAEAAGGDDAPTLPALPDPDFVLVDGRFRVACALEVLLSGTRPLVAVHDWDRAKYHVVLPFFDVVEVAGRLAVLRPRHEWDADAARAMYDEHLGRPD